MAWNAGWAPMLLFSALMLVATAMAPRTPGRWRLAAVLRHRASPGPQPPTHHPTGGYP
jgi:hypothetical protein